MLAEDFELSGEPFRFAVAAEFAAFAFVAVGFDVASPLDSGASDYCQPVEELSIRDHVLVESVVAEPVEWNVVVAAVVVVVDPDNWGHNARELAVEQQLEAYDIRNVLWFQYYQL